MTIGLVHNVMGNGGATPQSQTVTATTAGNLIVVGIVGSPQTAVVTGVTDNASGGTNIYTQALSARAATNSTNALFTDIYYCFGAKSTTSITVAITAASTIDGIAVWEFSGTSGLAFDVAGGAVTNTAAATIVGPAITTASAGEVICAVCADTDGVASIASPYNVNPLTNLNGHAGGYHITTTTVSGEKCTFNDSSTGAGCVSSAALGKSGSVATKKKKHLLAMIGAGS